MQDAFATASEDFVDGKGEHRDSGACCVDEIKGRVSNVYSRPFDQP